MKIECIKDKLTSVVSKAEKITTKNSTLPVLSCLFLEAKNNNLIIRATNLDLGLEVSFPVKVEKEGIVAVSGMILNSFLSNISGDKNITLEVVENNLYIKTKNNKTIIKTFNHEDFPIIPTVSKEKTIKINPKEFAKGLKSVWYSGAFSSVKPELSSVYIYEDGENIVFAATDSFRLAEKKVLIKKMKEFNHFLIPLKNIPEIIKVLEEAEGDMDLDFDKHQIAFSYNGVYLTSRIIDGVFPDYKQIIPKEVKTSVIVLKQDIVNSLKIANVFSDKFNKVNLKVDPKIKTFEIKTKNSDFGENVNKLDAVVKGEGVDINLNYKYISDCFQSINSDSVAISFNGANKAVIVNGVSDKSFTYLVMPMNN